MKRILTGDRTTGHLHLGHYVGSLTQRVALQDEYEEFILLADVQALTTHFSNPELINGSIYDVAMDNLAVGLDPEKVTFVQQSMIPSIAELTIFYSMLVTVNQLGHNPTIKTEAKNYGYKELTYGFLGYPVSQTADITFCNADLVPVGEDQIPHIELARKIVRKFNDLYGILNYIMVDLGILDEPYAWMSGGTTAMLILILANVWRGTPLMLTMFLAGLQGISLDMYEAADVDGCSRWQRLVYITLPQLKNTIVLSTLLRAVWEFNNVDVIYNLTGGGPVNQTTTLTMYLTQTAVRDNNFGYGSAIAVIAFLLLSVFAALYIKLTGFSKEEE